MEFSRQEYWNGFPFPSPGNLPDPGIELMSLMSLPLAAGASFTTIATWEAPVWPITSSNQQGDIQCFLATQITYMALHNQGTTSHHLCYVLMVRTKGRDNT